MTSTSVTVNNTEYDPHGDSYHRQSAIGKAIQVNVTINPKRTISKTQFQPQNFPNEFKVSFSHPKLSEQADKANYNVMATDYKNYSIGKNIFRSVLFQATELKTLKYVLYLVMSCQDFPGFKVEFGWILARDRLFRETDAYKQVKDLADTFKFDFKDSITANQDPRVCPKIILK